MSRKSQISWSHLDKTDTWASYIGQVRRRAPQRLGVIGPLLNKPSGLSIRKGLTLHTQFIHPMVDYACPVWRNAANSHTRRLQVSQSKCLRIIAGAPWYIRSLAQSFESKIPDSEVLLIGQLGRYLFHPKYE